MRRAGQRVRHPPGSWPCRGKDRDRTAPEGDFERMGLRARRQVRWKGLAEPESCPRADDAVDDGDHERCSRIPAGRRYRIRVARADAEQWGAFEEGRIPIHEHGEHAGRPPLVGLEEIPVNRSRHLRTLAGYQVHHRGAEQADEFAPGQRLASRLPEEAGQFARERPVRAAVTGCLQFERALVGRARGHTDRGRVRVHVRESGHRVHAQPLPRRPYRGPRERAGALPGLRQRRRVARHAGRMTAVEDGRDVTGLFRQRPLQLAEFLGQQPAENPIVAVVYVGRAQELDPPGHGGILRRRILEPRAVARVVDDRGIAVGCVLDESPVRVPDPVGCRPRLDERARLEAERPEQGSHELHVGVHAAQRPGLTADQQRSLTHRSTSGDSLDANVNERCPVVGPGAFFR